MFKYLIIFVLSVLLTSKLYSQGYFGARPDYHMESDTIDDQKNYVQENKVEDEKQTTSENNSQKSYEKNSPNIESKNNYTDNKKRNDEENIIVKENHGKFLVMAKKAFREGLYLESELHLKNSLKFNKKDFETWELLSKIYKKFGLKKEFQNAKFFASKYKKKPIFPKNARWPMETKEFIIKCKMMIFCEYKKRIDKTSKYFQKNKKVSNFAEKSLQAMGIY